MKHLFVIMLCLCFRVSWEKSFFIDAGSGISFERFGGHNGRVMTLVQKDNGDIAVVNWNDLTLKGKVDCP